MSLLTVNRLSIAGPRQPIVHELSFDIRAGEWFAVVGQSGSGKSVAASAIGQLLPSNLKATGEIRYDGRNLLALSPADMRRIRGRQIAYIFQDYQGAFTPFHTIGRHFDDVQRLHLSLSKDERRQQAESSLVFVGLSEEVYDRYPSQLSGGQLQRAAIAIALLPKPDLLIADEPTTALDSVSSFRVLELLSRLQKESGCAILFITHDWRHVRKYADRIAVMKDGRIVEAGDAQEVLHRPRHPYTELLIQSSPSLSRFNRLSSSEVTS
ncbi:ABC transporter ATP-binding protein [Paenibacillus methanolicus]|uniref:Peptide/nickel transport system ATP-binding protein n=1 Tax=Paenibacillus methanolicus TaxID=582686 RepID=A0A5S5C193_9BACL|nr:ABC transporter ATP-binding protein [Paenibacillus methanolicus]TYP72100.1 peptide/nickel transport system ATP-binding protein [Paenibacillus methanolicus]